MTARRVLWLLIIALGLISAAIWLSSQRHLERDLASGSLVLPGLQPALNAVTTLGLRKGDGTHTALQRSGGAWLVSERGWPAEGSKVRKLLLDMGALTIVEEKTRLPANYPALGVEDVNSPQATGTLVDVVTPAHTWSLIVGKSSSGKSGFVRVAGAAQSLLAAPLLSVDADPKAWLEHALLDLPAERVREVQQQPAKGPAFSATREKKEQSDFTVSPLPKGRQLTGPGAAEPLAGALAGLTLDDVHKAAVPADAQVSRASWRTFDGLEVQLAGRKDGTHPLVVVSVRSSAKETEAEAQRLAARLDGWEFEIPDYKYSVIFTPLEELLQKPPEPAKKPNKSGKAAPSAMPSR